MSPLRRSACSSLSRLLIVALAALYPLGGMAADGPWQDLQEQNRELRAQLKTQQQQLDDLRVQMNRLAGVPDVSTTAARPPTDHKLVLSGEAGLAFFRSTREGQYPNAEFRADDVFLRLEAPLALNAYLFGELQLSRREGNADDFLLGEFYVDFENVSGALGGPERLVNLRFGRLDIPFGEEYLVRDPLLNPLVTHSLSDIWGTDEGIEVYGELGHASYAFAVQNGSTIRTRDFNSDKSLTFRFGYDLLPQLHVSASALRTGKLDSVNDAVSEVWIGNVVFRNIGGAQSNVHQAEIAEVDATYTWPTGRVWASAGKARYRDNDPLADNTRHFSYYQIEAVQSLHHQFYGALRFSQMRVDHGYPFAGIADLGEYFFTTLQTKELQRWSVGGGYRFNPSLVLKFDYTIENGTLTTGASRDTRMISFETALGF